MQVALRPHLHPFEPQPVGHQREFLGQFGGDVAFVVTKIDKPTSLLTTIIAASMGVGSLILAPAIVFGYAVKAAAREDRQRAAAKAAKAEKAARRVD